MAERWVGTCRRELLDHVIVFNEEHLRRLLREFLAYYHDDRTHLSLGKDPPAERAVSSLPPTPCPAPVAFTTATSGEKPLEQRRWDFGEAQVAPGHLNNRYWPASSLAIDCAPLNDRGCRTPIHSQATSSSMTSHTGPEIFVRLKALRAFPRRVVCDIRPARPFEGRPLMPPTVIDTNKRCTLAAPVLFASGFRTVIRYYSEFTQQKEKCVTLPEALALGRAGLRLGVVYQDGGTVAAGFTQSKGFRAGRYVYSYAQGTIHQAPGSAIYFAVDFDASKTEVKQNISPFFQGVATGFQSESGGVPDCAVGVYGSGLVCASILDAGLASFAWISQSMGFTGTKEFLKTNRWHLKQNLPEIVCGLDADTNDRNPAQPDIGDFAPDLDILAEHPIGTLPAQRFVIARDGLVLRGGPSRDFPRLRTLPFGTSVIVLAEQDDWVQVDLHGDGAADGYCFAGYLAASVP